MNFNAFLIIADGALDQICHTWKDAHREAEDLAEMGCKVIIIPFADETTAQTTWDDITVQDLWHLT